MNKTNSVSKYGVRETSRARTKIDTAVEQIRLVGYCRIASGLSKQEQNKIKTEFDRLLEEQNTDSIQAKHLRSIDEHNTLRAPLLKSKTMLELAQNPNITSIAEKLFGASFQEGCFILNQQNGILNPGNSQRYNQGAYHRDLPYQHFTSSRPVGINALYCIDPFSRENGATFVLPGSHKVEEFPSEQTVRSIAVQIEANPGDFLVLDAMLFHSGGINRTQFARKAINHVYTLPIIRQQIQFSGAIGDVSSLSSETQNLLGLNMPTINSVAEYWQARAQKVR